MWVLPSRSRPRNLERLIAACHKTGMTTPLWLRLDDDDAMLGGYLELPMPDDWITTIGPRVPLSDIYNEAYSRFEADWWGFIADDVVPETPGWDIKLIDLAGNDGMAVPDGGNGTPHFVLAGSLAQEQGWLSLPGLHRLFIDTVWADIAQEKGTLRRAPDVTLRHLHFSTGHALKDTIYRKPNRDEDRRIYEEWHELRIEEGQVHLHPGSPDGITGVS